MVVDKAGRMLLEIFLGATFVGVSFLQSNKQIANLRNPYIKWWLNIPN